MLVPRAVRSRTQRLQFALIPALRKLHLPPLSSPSVPQSHSPAISNPGHPPGTMLREAVQAHESEKSQKNAFLNNVLLESSEQHPSMRSINPDYKNPLKPTTASSLNQAQGSQPSQRSTAGIKRTASGLAKVLHGSFDSGPGSQQHPIVLNGSPTTKQDTRTNAQADMFDENEFDSDIELDVEAPMPKSTISYPKLPSQPLTRPASGDLSYPTLPNNQRARMTPKSKTDLVDGPVVDDVASPLPKPSLGSSAPLPWSSSPAEHYNAAMKPSQLRQFAYTESSAALPSTVPPKQPPQPRQAKRRLPWEVDDGAPEPDAESMSFIEPAKSKASKGQNFTPLPKNTKSSQYPWNTSASAVKEQQKKHREDTKKAVKKLDGTDESIRTAKSNQKRPARVFLSDEQQHVLDLVIEKKKSVFFTGSAGTGKSVLMREIISSLRKKYAREPDRVAVTASTGLAACNVGGVTLHSFAGIGLGKEDVPELVRKIKKNQKAKHRWLRTKVLIVDEVSMVDGELFDKLEAIARQIRNNARPFGGLQVVITGDFFQLPPVPENNRVAKFAFDAATWKTSIEHTIGLHHVFRQKDPIFAGMLNEMREGRLTESSIKAFRNLSRALTFEDMLDATELFPTRAEVDKANSGRLSILQGDNFPFPARDGGSIIDKVQRDRLLQNCLAPELITLKKGAQVMLIKNIDETLVNGSIGRVIGFLSERDFDVYNTIDGAFPQSQGGTIQTPGASLNDGEVKARLTESITTSTKWPLVRFAIADGTCRDLLCQPESWKVELPNGEVQASRQQIPLILAWALSIHKAQGQTLDRVKVDLGKVFEKGQAYVALSRATSMTGLQVLRFDPKKVNAHERVRTFYSNLSRVELAEKNKERLENLSKPGSTTATDYESRYVQGGMD